MTIVKLNPFGGFEKAARRVNEFFGDIDRNVNFEIGGFSPRVDILDDDKRIVFKAEFPGIRKEDIKISVNEDKMLIISGTKRKEDQYEDMSYLRSERVYSDFKRSFVLPDNLDTDRIAAKYENGVLEISLPKVEPPAPKEIEIL
jgi:HSP20 family protein